MSEYAPPVVPLDEADRAQRDPDVPVLAVVRLGRLAVGVTVRQGIGVIGVLVTTAALLLLPPLNAGPMAWLALGLAGTMFALEPTRPVRWLFEQGGGATTALLISLLLLGTGGTASVFQDLFAIVLLYSAVVRGWKRLAADTVVVAIAAAVPAAVERADVTFWIDLTVDLMAWVALAVLAGLLARRLGRARSRSEHLRSVIDEVADTVTVLDATTGRVEYANRIAADVVGMHPDDVVGHPVWTLTDALDEAAVRDLVDSLEVGGPARVVEHTSERTDPPRTWQSSARLVSADGGAGRQLVLIARDITAQREMEANRAEALEHERALAEEVRRTAVAQRTFLQSVSHELRTPLTVVAGVAATLHAHGDEISREMRIKLLTRLVANTERLDDLLRDLMDVAGMAVAPEPDRLTVFALRDLCDAAVLRAGVAVKALEIDVPDVEVRGDESSIERALAGLVRNATVHTPQGTRVFLHAHVCDDQLTMIVEDDGPGVPERIRETMFAPFVQGPAAVTAATPGVGIGLALARQVAESHDGHAWHEPVEPHGSRFCLRLRVSCTASV